MRSRLHRLSLTYSKDMTHLDALTDKGKTIFPRLSYFSDFYLAGGTALALQIGHRVSVDFDFFHEDKIKRTLLPSVEKVFDQSKRHVLVNNANELTILVDEVKITFLSYPFPVILPKTHIGEIVALSVAEIGATKAYTIGRRGMFKSPSNNPSVASHRSFEQKHTKPAKACRDKVTKVLCVIALDRAAQQESGYSMGSKDYVDVYAILHGGHATFQELIMIAEKKYGNAFDARLFLEQLSYFDDLEESPIVFLGETLSMAEIASFFSAEIKKLEI